ncbi:MAG: AAA family ATPase [Gammaproteobacteria bacterium]|nr:AAA family ATPase [Gammaproteobacteria bacterium]
MRRVDLLMASKSKPLLRYLAGPIKDDLQRKMVFLGGPRQVGKTTLALGLLGAEKSRHPGYLNWDDPRVRPELLRGNLPGNESLLVLDEIHKYPRWRNLVKGFYDTRGDHVSFLVTGSARLDHYRKGGDSLQGRYHHYRLHPFSLSELNTTASKGDLEALMQFGGFPEPLLSGEMRAWRRWQRERMSRVVYEDIRDLENVRQIALIELLLEALPERVGSPLSIKSLSEDLQVAHATVDRWLGILANMYVCFRIPPFGAPRIRAVKKETKLYFWDWSQVREKGGRFENLVACHLLKYCHHLEDTEGYRMELRFLRDTDRREIDFVVLRNHKPLFAVECKSGEKSPSTAIDYFRQRTGIPAFYQVHLGRRDYVANDGTRVLPFRVFCREMVLP